MLLDRNNVHVKLRSLHYDAVLWFDSDELFFDAMTGGSEIENYGIDDANSFSNSGTFTINYDDGSNPVTLTVRVTMQLSVQGDNAIRSRVAHFDVTLKYEFF
jgi:hypothetical protein